MATNSNLGQKRPVGIDAPGHPAAKNSFRHWLGRKIFNIFRTTPLAHVMLALAGVIALSPAFEAYACTRVVFHGDKGNCFTGRTLDWRTPIPTNLYVMPRGISRVSYDEEDAIDWTSRYASVVAVGYDLGATEGMNEEGLVVNCLYLPGTKYTFDGDTRKKMSSSVWVLYVLDNFSTVSDAVAHLSRDIFHIDAPAMPDGSSTTVHMAISDKTGDNAIIEYLDGKISIHQGHQYKVLTNAPPFDQQIAIAKYWESVGGLNFLPGTNRSQDRFARAWFYVNAVPTDADHDLALAAVMGILNNCSVPVGISLPDNPEISTTQWRSISDQKNKVYYYMTTLNPSIIWLDLNDFDLNPGAPIMKLDMMDGKHSVIGNAVKAMKPSKGFTPMYRVPADLKL